MLVILTSGHTPAEIDLVRRTVEGLGARARDVQAGPVAALIVSGGDPDEIRAVIAALPGVRAVLPVARPLRHVHPGAGERRGLPAPLARGRGGLALVAGPCAVESEEQLLPLARRLAAAGADALRGGAYKPRTSPYEFQGLGEPGLRLLARAGRETGLPVITEAVDAASLDLVVRHADVVQIGARNMHNFELLKAAGRAGRPVLLKRGFAATLEDWLLAAEYVMEQGNEAVVLCERGIRTFSNHSRFTLDLGVVPQVRAQTRLPIIVDPSHASGVRRAVPPLARAAVAAGADGVMIEVHPDPATALSDGAQSLAPDEFATLARDLRALAELLATAREAVP